MKIFSTGWSEGFDGPGRRWVVYAKGCNFRCRWCGNPEGLRMETEMLFYPERGQSPEKACPYGAVQSSNGTLEIERGKCTKCPDRACLTTWKHPAFEYAGQEISAEEIIAKAQQYHPLFGPDGGITFGGGEATLQAEEILRVATALREKGIHTVLETNAATKGFTDCLGKFDHLICDLKCITPELHQEWCGSDNTLALENIRKAVETGQDLRLRLVIVPGVTDSPEELEKISQFFAALAKLRNPLPVEILRMHHLGVPKYQALGLAYQMAGVPEPKLETAEKFAEKLRASGIEATVVG
ncbi:MAG: glycyl-radical enzyme activating protein [Planctomycetes bacterium]|nr:glycyl-radical enzyme activating protein [Planctomycetota bacterium]